MDNKKSCESCTNIEGCLKYCDIQMGKSIIDFVNGIDCIETKIGDFRDPTGSLDKGTVYQVTGIELVKGAANIDIITVLPSSGLSVQNKLSDYKGQTPTQYLKKYLVHCNMSKQVKDKSSEDLRKFNTFKIIPTPFHIGTDIEVVYTGFDKKSHKTYTNANMIKWALDENGKLCGYIIADIGRDEVGAKYTKVKLCDYGKTWFLPNIERNFNTSELKYDAIRMTNIGLIDPIEIHNKGLVLAMDSQHIYYIDDEDILIIGEWAAEGMKLHTGVSPKITKSPAFKKLKEISKFVEKHRRFIIPYGFAKSNIIEV